MASPPRPCGCGPLLAGSISPLVARCSTGTCRRDSTESSHFWTAAGRCADLLCIPDRCVPTIYSPSLIPVFGLFSVAYGVALPSPSPSTASSIRPAARLARRRGSRSLGSHRIRRTGRGCVSSAPRSVRRMVLEQSLSWPSVLPFSAAFSFQRFKHAWSTITDPYFARIAMIGSPTAYLWCEHNHLPSGPTSDTIHLVSFADTANYLVRPVSPAHGLHIAFMMVPLYQ